MQSFPVSTRPGEGEAFDSWAERLGSLNHSTVPALMAAAGFDGWSYRGGSSVFGVVHEAEPMASLMGLARISPAEGAATLLDAYDGVAFDLSDFRRDGVSSLRRTWQTSWCSVSRSRACSDCLTETESQWQKSWRLAFHFACVRHGRLLVDACPGCGVPFRTTQGARPYPGAPMPDRCVNRVGGRVCGARLADVPHGPNSSNAEIEAQRQVLSMLDQRDGRAFGEPVDRTGWFATLRLTAMLARKASVPDEFMGLSTAADEAVEEAWWRRHLPGLSAHAMWTLPPIDAALSAGVLTRAIQLMEQDTLDEVAWLADRSVRDDRSEGRRVWLPSLPHQPSWWRGLWASHFAARSQMDRFWLPPLPGLVPSRLPGALPEAQMLRFGDLFVGSMRDKARVFAAVAVARAAGSASWRAAWRDLGYPEIARYRSWVELPLQRVREAGRERELSAAAFDVAARMGDWCGRDHSPWRGRLAGLVDVDDDLWFRLLGEVSVGGQARRQRSKYAAMWVWASSTGGYFRFSPAGLHAEVEGVGRATITAGFRRFEALIGAHSDLRRSLLDELTGQPTADPNACRSRRPREPKSEPQPAQTGLP